MTETKLPAFPFFVGVPRSGTTLVRAMFDSHPEMTVPPESDFIAPLAKRRHMYERDGAFDVANFTADLYANAHFRKWGFVPDDIAGILGEAKAMDFASAIRTLFSEYARRKGKSRYADKTPRYLVQMSKLAKIFPEALFVHLIRDGRDAVCSYVETPFGRPDLDAAARRWRNDVSVGREEGIGLGGRYREIRYEELVSDPEAVLATLCPFLDLDYHPAMLRFTERADEIVAGAMVPAAHQNIYRVPTVGLRDWRRDMAQVDLALVELIAGRVLTEFDYETTLHDVPWTTRVRALTKMSALIARRKARQARRIVRRTIRKMIGQPGTSQP